MPAMSPEKLLERLSRGKPVRGHRVATAQMRTCGKCAASRIIDAFVPEGMRDWAVARMSARESGWDEIVQRAQTLPMLAPRQVILRAKTRNRWNGWGIKRASRFSRCSAIISTRPRRLPCWFWKRHPPSISASAFTNSWPRKPLWWN